LRRLPTSLEDTGDVPPIIASEPEPKQLETKLRFLIACLDLAGQAHPPKPEQGRDLGLRPRWSRTTTGIYVLSLLSPSPLGHQVRRPVRCRFSRTGCCVSWVDGNCAIWLSELRKFLESEAHRFEPGVLW